MRGKQKMSEKQFATITELVLAFNEEELLKVVDEALNQGVNPADIISMGLSPGLEAIGAKFEAGEDFLPELMISGNLMKNALEKIRPFMVSADGSSAGKVIMGTVEGDIHHIGKNVFISVLEGDGYEICDLGEDVAPAIFLEKAKELQPDIIGLSSLISTGVSKMAETITLLKDNRIKADVIVGGAAVTETNSKLIGADGYGFDAWAGLRIVREMTANREK